MTRGSSSKSNLAAVIRAVIFDFDGLILETEEPDYLAWQEVYREHGADLHATPGRAIDPSDLRVVTEPAARTIDRRELSDEQILRLADLQPVDYDPRRRTECAHLRRGRAHDPPECATGAWLLENGT